MTIKHNSNEIKYVQAIFLYAAVIKSVYVKTLFKGISILLLLTVTMLTAASTKPHPFDRYNGYFFSQFKSLNQHHKKYNGGKYHGIELYYTSDRKVGAAKYYVDDREML
jgi:hypothetical protein